MNILGTDFSESDGGEFTEGTVGDRGFSRPVGIYAVAIEGTFTASSSSNSDIMIAVESAIDFLKSISFPRKPGVKWNLYGAQAEFEWDTEKTVSGTLYRARAFNKGTSSPYGVIERSSDGVNWVFINPCSPGVRVERGNARALVRATKTMLVFGGSNGSGSAIGFCVPRPVNSRVCVFDSVRRYSSTLGQIIESNCSIDSLSASGGVLGRIETGRRVRLGPPSRGFGTLNPTLVIDDPEPPTPQWIRRMYAPNIPHVPTGFSNWPPISAAPCCNLT